MKHLSVFLFALLLTASLMWPSEGALHGDGLHLAFGWLITGAIVAIGAATRACGRRKLSRPEVVAGLTMTLLVGGVWLSTWRVFQVHGDRRAALNLAFEWSAIGAVWWIAHRMVRDQHGRQWIVALLIGLGVGTSIVGIVQHHITHRRQAEWYQQQRARVDGMAASADAHYVVDSVSASQELRRMDVPLDGPARELFERRLLGSSEPSGPFALANTLGGILALSLVLLLGGVLQSLRKDVRIPLMTWASIIVAGCLMGYCLLLTKSRTAWVGFSFAVCLLLFQGRAALTSPRVRHLVAGSVVLLVLGAAIGIQTGAIDKEVVLESPRSLQFRLFYWMGAAGVIGEDPLFGTGPGNFRQLYLKHKVVESSEEILDPHNIILDAWCTAGFAGGVAVCLLLVTILSLLFRPSDNDSADAHVETWSRDKLIQSSVLWGIGGGLLLHVIWRWFNGGELIDTSGDIFDSQNVVLVIPVAAVLAVTTLIRRVVFSVVVLRAAFVCLFVHLLGAGGLQISGLVLALVLLHALSLTEAGDLTDGSDVPSKWSGIVGVFAVGFVVAAGVTFWHGLVPDRTADASVELATMLQSQGKHDAAVRMCNEATDADPYGTISRQRKMEVLSYMFVATVNRYARSDVATADELKEISKLYDRTVAACEDVINADQRTYAGYYFRSRVSDQFHSVKSNEFHRENAVKDLEHVICCYPTNSAFWFEYADLQYRSSEFQKARPAALRAMEIDHINREWGHLDRYLSADRRARLQLIAGSN